MLECIAGVLIHHQPLCAVFLLLTIISEAWKSYNDVHLPIVSFFNAIFSLTKLATLYNCSNTLPRETFLHNIETLVDCGYGWDLLGNGKDG